MFHRPTHPGFTLIELLTYMGISAVVLVVVTSLMINLSAHTARERVDHDLQSTGQTILNRLTYNIRNATSQPTVSGATLSIPTSAGSIVYTISGTYLTEQLPSSSAEQLNDATTAIQSWTIIDEGFGISVSFAVATSTNITPNVSPKSFQTTLIPRRTLYD